MNSPQTAEIVRARRGRADVAAEPAPGERRLGRPGQARSHQAGGRGAAGRGARPDRGRARAWARRCSPGPWPRASTARSGGSSSRPTCCPRTSSARASTTPPSGEFVFKPGPIFANVILADEINRTTPRTQSALLEAMSDRQVSVEGKTYPLDPPFLVLATQNPYEFEGTYVLPESQLDRFMIRLRMGYPLRSEERRVLVEPPRAASRSSRSGRSSRPTTSSSSSGPSGSVRVDDAIADYLLDIVHATREGEDLHVGVSTRGALTLYRAAQSLALVSGRDYVVPDDIKIAGRAGPGAPGRRQVVPPGRRVRRGRGDHPRHRRPAPGARRERPRRRAPASRAPGLMADRGRDRPTESRRRVEPARSAGSSRASGRPSGSVWTREGLVYFVRLARPARDRACYQQINLILLVAGLAAGPIVALDLRQRVDAPAGSGSRGGCPPTSSRASRCAIDYTLENDRRWTAALALIRRGRRWSRSTARSPGSAGPDAAGLLRPGRRPATGRGSAGKGVSPERGQVPVPDAGAGHPVAVRPARAAGHDRRARRADRLPDGRPAHPPLAPASSAQASETRRGPAARPLGPAAGIPRPARLPARRQPALDPLADLGPARQADGQGVRAAERAGPGDPARPLAAPDQGDARAARGAGAGDPVRRDGLPGDLPAPGPAAPPGLDRADARASGRGRRRSSCSTSCSSNSPCCGRRPRGRSRPCSTSLPAVDPPRGDPDRRLDPADQPDRGGRAVVAALGRRRRGACSAG